MVKTRANRTLMCTYDSLPKASMAVPTSFGLCCCCLELPCPKSMWSEHTWMGQIEVYGDMVKECFGITFPDELNSKEQKICEVCITRLRNSLRFRRQVALCHARILQQLDTMLNSDPTNSIKVEVVENEQEKLRPEYIIEFTVPSNNINIPIDGVKVEELPSDDKYNDDSDSHHNDQIDLPKNESADKPVAKVTNKAFKMSRRSVHIKDRRTCPRADHIKPRENIGRLLLHTTILPFKSNKGYFNCFYCNKQFVVIDDLRAHVSTVHHDVTFLAIVKNILRPHDRIKADIGNLRCKICHERCDNLEHAIQHLESHSIKFNYDDKLLKPNDCLLAYDLSDGKFTCVVCKAEFHFFKTLTKHMNEHSTNYVCDVCGKCFLLSERLKAHRQVHVSWSGGVGGAGGSGGVGGAAAGLACELCGKLCASAGTLRSHKRHHHKKRSHVCGICNHSFPTFKQRMQHLEDVHNRSPLNITCNICLKKFNTTSRLGLHMRTEHYNIPYVRKRKKKGEEKAGCQKMNNF